MQRRTTLIVACAAVLAAAGTYFAYGWPGTTPAPTASGAGVSLSSGKLTGKPVTPPPSSRARKTAKSFRALTAPSTSDAMRTLLPPPDTPLADIWDDLDARAAAGDADAASRQYRDLMRCDYASYWIPRESDNAASILAHDSQELNEDVLDFAQRQLDHVAKLHALCDGLEPSTFNQITPVMLRAAKLGDPAARDCYVHRGPYADPASMLKNPRYLSQYTRDAPPLIDAALAEGDWKMVDMLQHAYAARGGSLISGLVESDPVQHYRYLKLFSLGSHRQNDEEHPSVDEQRLAEAAKALAPHQIAQADGWAQREFDQHFRGSSTEAAPHGWNACTIPDN